MLLETFTLAQLLKPKEPELPQPKPVQTVKVEPKKKKIIKPQKYRIQQGDTLIKVAKKHKTTWQRIYYKNKSIKNPDQLKVGAVIYLPSKHEKLKKREYIQVETKRALQPIKNASQPQSNYATASDGWYPAGQCTWWVSTKRAVGQWGNASDWLANAQRDGVTTGSVPRAGAVGWTSGHVVYIESVQGDMVTVSEANYDWNGSIRTITVPASKYTYIY